LAWQHNNGGVILGMFHVCGYFIHPLRVLSGVCTVQVVERVVEVEPDKAALVEQLRAQMKAEMEAQQEQQLQGQALEAARQEAEARARQQLEVSTSFPGVAVFNVHAQQCGHSGQLSCRPAAPWQHPAIVVPAL
jgi:hypothetical protein